MKIVCNRCNKEVSTEVPDDTVLKAWVECPECSKKKGKKEPRILNRTNFTQAEFDKLK